MKIVVSISQAILWMIDKVGKDSHKGKVLARLYLDGRTDSNATDFDEALADIESNSEFQKKFIIDKTFTAQNQCPSRRYFETRLAYETLAIAKTPQLLSIIQSQMTWYKDKLDEYAKKMVDKEGMLITRSDGRAVIRPTKEILDEIASDKQPYDSFAKELREIMAIIKEKFSSQALSELYGKAVTEDMAASQRKVVESLVIFNYLAREYSTSVDIYRRHFPQADVGDDFFPLDIYNAKGSYFSGSQRGRIDIESNTWQVYSEAVGILFPSQAKSYQDVSQLPRGIGRDLPNVLRTKPDDKAAYPKRLKESLIHPFVNAISGFTCLHLRAIHGFLLKKPEGVSCIDNIEKMMSFLKMLSSVILLGSGGHCYIEMVDVMHVDMATQGLAEVFAAVSGESPTDCHDTLKSKTLSNILLEGNERAFDHALSASISYNKQLLKRQQLMMQVKINGAARRFKSLTSLDDFTLGYWSIAKEKNLEVRKKLHHILDGYFAPFLMTKMDCCDNEIALAKILKHIDKMNDPIAIERVQAYGTKLGLTFIKTTLIETQQQADTKEKLIKLKSILKLLKHYDERARRELTHNLALEYGKTLTALLDSSDNASESLDQIECLLDIIAPLKGTMQDEFVKVYTQVERGVLELAYKTIADDSGAHQYPYQYALFQQLCALKTKIDKIVPIQADCIGEMIALCADAPALVLESQLNDYISVMASKPANEYAGIFKKSKFTNGQKQMTGHHCLKMLQYPEQYKAGYLTFHHIEGVLQSTDFAKIVKAHPRFFAPIIAHVKRSLVM